MGAHLALSPLGLRILARVLVERCFTSGRAEVEFLTFVLRLEPSRLFIYSHSANWVDRHRIVINPSEIRLLYQRSPLQKEKFRNKYQVLLPIALVVRKKTIQAHVMAD